MLLGAFIVHGVQPGPFFITDYPQIFWAIIASLVIGNVMLVVLNLPLIGLWVQILKIPYRLLFPLIIIFCFVGVYSLNSSRYDLLIMVIFSPIGYFLRRVEYPTGPFLMGMVLGPMMESGLRQSLTISMGTPAIFFQRPIAASLLILTLLTICFISFKEVQRKRLAAKK